MREASPTDFALDVPEVGHFMFARRTLRDRFRIGAMHHRLTEGTAEDNSGFSMVAEAYATLSVLMVEGPEGFEDRLNLDGVDPGDDNETVILKVFFELRQKEGDQRKDATKSSEAEGEGAS